ncbi:hypothetical protein AVEN_194766-1 [Araneus ventricosus]|uniref:Uncharacterized protein n=1 Tax=Araneus ventricosus TaxID=182803 RepID=A0A4Y2B3W3_ARAVE|nr:hypothetical protein AVEN_194766-1 [Araneus ventricosus]
MIYYDTTHPGRAHQRKPQPTKMAKPDDRQRALSHQGQPPGASTLKPPTTWRSGPSGGQRVIIPITLPEFVPRCDKSSIHQADLPQYGI